MQRFSKKRAAIYDCLCGTKTHPSADWIYQQLLPEFPDLSLATVYRNLAQLKEAGIWCVSDAVQWKIFRIPAFPQNCAAARRMHPAGASAELLCG